MEVLDRYDATRVRELLDRGEFFWLALRGADAGVIAEAGEALGLHRLAIADSQEFRQRPKLDDYPGSVLLVFYGASMQGSLPEPVEVHFHITRKAIVTVRRADADGVEDAAHEALDLHEVERPFDALYRVLDLLAGSFDGPLTDLEAELDAIEDQLIDHPSPHVRRRLLDIKHALVRMRQVVDPQRDVLAARRYLIERLTEIDLDDGHDELRDLYDRLTRTSQQIEVVRELISNALDLYVSAVANRQNEVMKTLTIIATFFLPLSVLTGFFGQNFGWLVRNIQSGASFFLLGVGGAAVMIGVLWLFLRSKGYLRPTEGADVAPRRNTVA